MENLLMFDAPADRRACHITGAYALALLYTGGYLAMVGALFFVDIPPNNKEVMLTLIGIMSAAQMAIIKHYFDGSKGAEAAQIANITRASRTDAVIQEIATKSAVQSPQKEQTP